MPIYLSRGRFTSEAVKGMLANQKIVRKLLPSSSRVSEVGSSGGT